SLIQPLTWTYALGAPRDIRGKGYSCKRSNFGNLASSELVVDSTRPDRTFRGKLLSWALRLSEYPSPPIWSRPRHLMAATVGVQSWWLWIRDEHRPRCGGRGRRAREAVRLGSAAVARRTRCHLGRH